MERNLLKDRLPSIQARRVPQVSARDPASGAAETGDAQSGSDAQRLAGQLHCEPLGFILQVVKLAGEEVLATLEVPLTLKGETFLGALVV